MTYVFRILILMLVGLFVSLSASADDRLTVTGGIDNRIYGGSNLSAFDYNFTNLALTKGNSQAGDADDLAVAITRLRVTLSMEAFENTKMVFDTVTDQAWGGGAGANALHIGNYKKVINVERLFFEGLIPNTAATMQAGGLFFEGTRLKSWTLFNMNAAGATIAAPFSDTVNTYTWFAWLGEGYDDVGKVDGKADGGNDWALGTRVEFTPMQDLDVDLIFAYQRLECLDQESGFAGDCDVQTLLVRNSKGTDGKSLQTGSRVMYENRAWVGIDVRYQFGDFTFSPTLIYHFGETELDQSGAKERSTPSCLMSGRHTKWVLCSCKGKSSTRLGLRPVTGWGMAIGPGVGSKSASTTATAAWDGSRFLVRVACTIWGQHWC